MTDMAVSVEAGWMLPGYDIGCKRNIIKIHLEYH